MSQPARTKLATVSENARFSCVSEMKQNPARFAACLSIIWRNALNTIKYPETRLNAVD